MQSIDPREWCLGNKPVIDKLLGKLIMNVIKFKSISCELIVLLILRLSMEVVMLVILMNKV